jgi:hypothetical protein
VDEGELKFTFGFEIFYVCLDELCVFLVGLAGEEREHEGLLGNGGRGGGAATGEALLSDNRHGENLQVKMKRPRAVRGDGVGSLYFPYTTGVQCFRLRVAVSDWKNEEDNFELPVTARAAGFVFRVI